MHRIPGRVSNYDKQPFIASRGTCIAGWPAIAGHLGSLGARVIVIEAYAGVMDKDLETLVNALGADLVIDASEALKSEEEIEALVGSELTSDPVFGFLTRLDLMDLFDRNHQEALRSRIRLCEGTVVVYGTGASLLIQGDVLVYADMPRWETQRRQRENLIANLGANNFGERPSLKYKRSFFLDWRLCDRLKKQLWPRMDFFVDTTSSEPLMIGAATLFDALEAATKRPFRVVPYFDPAPWGGQWMKEVCDLDRDRTNFGWCFDCVVEENSLMLGFGEHRFEVPATDLVFREPKALLGEAVFGRFGDEFPIRFDFLDTMGGGNLSMQVHPLTAYIQREFGMAYTQDESYYLLDAGKGGTVFLGLRENVDREAMVADLRRAEDGGFRFPDEKYINRFPAKRHDHFLLPAGTVHCSGAESMVLEISATPYIFTFKLWDWDRAGLDGRPRPLHIGHGANNIQWERDEKYVRQHLINQIVQVDQGNGWVEERTGLHEAEFIETRRHWFTKPVLHAASMSSIRGLQKSSESRGVNVLNLVEGEEAVVTSPDGAFDPFVVHYAETFIVPADAGSYQIAPTDPHSDRRCGTIKAYVRTNP